MKNTLKILTLGLIIAGSSFAMNMGEENQNEYILPRVIHPENIFQVPLENFINTVYEDKNAREFLCHLMLQGVITPIQAQKINLEKLYPLISKREVSEFSYPELFVLAISEKRPEYTNLILSYVKGKVEEGSIEHMNLLGVMYYKGSIVSQDYSEAFKLFQKTEEQGYAYSQFNLGYMYENGHGVKQDYEEAVRLYKLAANQRFPLAHNQLGSLYQHGHGVLSDYKQAVIQYLFAAKQGIISAQNNMGLMHEMGLGVPQDFEVAKEWYKLAKKEG